MASDVEIAFDKLNGSHEDVLLGVQQGRYVLWVGSGISYGVNPGLPELIARIIDFLSAKSDFTSATCPFKKALDEVLAFGDSSAVDPADPRADVGAFDALCRQLAGTYASVLNVAVGAERRDFLLWEAVDFIGTYGRGAAEAEVDHLCIAILVMEGLIPAIFSGNWDCNIEEAVATLSADPALHLLVTLSDSQIREARSSARLIKFHGCADLAEHDASFREMIVFRSPQVKSWTTDARFAAMRLQMEALSASHYTLMMGFSLGDNDITEALMQSFKSSKRSPTDQPAPFVFAQPVLTPGQDELMQAAFGDIPAPDLTTARDRATMSVYSRPFLVALTVSLLERQLEHALEALDGHLQTAEREALRRALRAGAKATCHAAGGDVEGFFGSFLFVLVFLSAAYHGSFRQPAHPAGRYGAPAEYLPMLGRSPAVAAPDAGGTAELAGALALLAHLWDDGVFEVEFAEDPATSMVLRKGSDGTRIFFVKDDRAAIALERELGSAVLCDPDVLLLHGRTRAPVQIRSARSVPGRTGALVPREVGIADLYEASTDLSGLLSRFRTEATL
ncbi:MAG TPA: SIR2 family protein [Iamia sp.]|nr:SIR2 family protein [Iamia sp.]